MKGQLALQDNKKSNVLPALNLLQHAAVQPIPSQTEKDSASVESRFDQNFSQVAAQSSLESSCAMTPTRCPFGGACHTCPAHLQAKVVINQPGDEYEQEADCMADMVMRIPEINIDDKDRGQLSSSTKTIQRQIANVAISGDVPPIIYDVLHSSGQPLDNETCSFMESRFGYDLSDIRVHFDTQAAKSAEAANALAYTIGKDMVFAVEQYKPRTTQGKKLLAHELTHVIQQVRDLKPQNHLFFEEVNHLSEHDNFVSNQPMGVNKQTIVPTLQRQPKPTVPTPSPSCTPRTGITEYGCYCGAGKSCTGFNCTPTNALDACCQQHDIAYGSCSFSDRFNPFSACYPITHRADAALCACAHGLAGRFGGATENYRLGIIGIFCGK